MSKIFTIDGTDASGKQTQVEKICKRFDDENIPYLKISFPRYDNPSSSLVKMYLGGDFGDDAQKISPYVASTFFAVDRFAAYMQEMKQAINEGKVIILDRYISANMIHQAGKISDLKKRDEFLEWLTNLEFGIYGIPEPTTTFFLNMPLYYAEKLMANRKNKITGENKKDIHEKSKEHLKAAYEAGCYVAKKYSWHEVMCVKDGEIRAIDDIHEEIYSEIKKIYNVK